MKHKKFRKIINKKLNKIWKHINATLINTNCSIQEKEIETWEIQIEHNDWKSTIRISSYCIVFTKYKELKIKIVEELIKCGKINYECVWDKSKSNPWTNL